MPARRKGSGFTRRKKKSSASSQQQQQQQQKEPSTSKKPSPKKTPAPAPASKRTSKRQQLALSLPRRTSPRIAALARKKMMEDGLLVDTEAEETQPQQLQLQGEAEQDVHVQDHLVLTNNDLELEVATTEVLVVNQGPVVTTTATATQLRGSQPYRRRARREPSPPRAEATAGSGSATDVAAVYFDDEEEQPLVEEGGEVGAPSSGLEGLQQPPPAPTPAPRQIVIDVEASLKESDEDFVSHAVLLHFGRSGGWKVTLDLALQWITANVGDRDTIGAIRYCRDLGRGFFSVYFESAIGRRRALAYRSPSKGIVVTVFPWCSDMLDSYGRELSPRMIALPGLVDNLVPLLPSIGGSLGTFVGALGVLAPDADIEAVREQTGWASACSGGGGASEPPPRVVVMMRSGEAVPASIKLKLRDGVYKTLQLYEQLPSDMKRKAAHLGSPMTAQRLTASKKRFKS